LGPCFRGARYTELSATFDGYGNCSSYAKEPGYRIPVDEGGINMLTNKKDGEFTISELEVWQVKYIE
jgi:hypothetical protein